MTKMLLNQHNSCRLILWLAKHLQYAMLRTCMCAVMRTNRYRMRARALQPFGNGGVIRGHGGTIPYSSPCRFVMELQGTTGSNGTGRRIVEVPCHGNFLKGRFFSQPLTTQDFCYMARSESRFDPHLRANTGQSFFVDELKTRLFRSRLHAKTSRTLRRRSSLKRSSSTEAVAPN